MDFELVTTKEDIHTLSVTAGEIWREYWPDIIGLDQTEYMIDMFHNEDTLVRDIHENNYMYWMLYEDGRVVGYTGAHAETDSNKLFISKIYLYACERGKGFASCVLRFYEDYCQSHGLTSLYLTVNKYNDLAIRTYNAKGFITIESVVSDIGQGYVMDDYIMEKKLL